MYYIYSDESGTSKPEAVTVVVGIIVHADKHWKVAHAALQQIFDCLVPTDLRKDFCFHATEVWSGYAEHKEWGKEDRLRLIQAVCSLPRLLGAAIALGRVRRDCPAPEIKSLQPFEWHHIYAFWRCMARANKYVRDWGESSEIATVIAENIPERAKFLRKILKTNPPHEFPLTPEYVCVTEKDMAAGKILQTHAGPIDRIVDTVHFVAKEDGPLLQIADACAYAFRRYFNSSEYCESLMEGIFGLPGVLNRSEWQGPSSEFLFSFNPNHRYPKLDLPPASSSVSHE